MKNYYLAWAVVITWTMVIGGCATPSPTQKHPVTQRFATEDGGTRRPAEPPSTANAVASIVTPAAFAATSRSPESEVEAIQTPVVVAPEFAGAMLESNISTADEPETATVPINLPTALAMIDGQHPVVGFAQWRVQEAYAQLDRAKVMWLPSIQSGVNYRRRDGNYQAVDGSIVDVNLNSFNYGLGPGAVAAGNPIRPGIVANFHLADAIFLPKVAEKRAWARGHAATATLNQQLLDAGLAYIELLEAFQEFEITSAAMGRTADLAKITRDYADTGEGLQSDADRTETELLVLNSRYLGAIERKMVASTQLARTLSIPMTSDLAPQDSVMLPLTLQDVSLDEASLIATGLGIRPELKEAQALVATAVEALRRERVAPLVPSVLMGFSTTRFGGGIGSQPESFGTRYDLDAMLVWELRNLGLGDHAAQRERSATIRTETFQKLQVMDQVAQEIAQANAQVKIRNQQREVAEQAIERAQSSYRLNLDRIRNGQGLPIEVLQSIQALESSERAYLNAVANFNRAQLQLQWALGWTVNASSPNDDVIVSR